MYLPNALRLSRRRHIFSSATSAAPIDAHAVVDAARAEAALGDLEAAAFAEQQASSTGTRTFSSSTSAWPCGASS